MITARDRLGKAIDFSQVMDVNDNGPEFSSAEFLADVPEDAEIGSTVLMLTATDKDNGQNRRVRRLAKFTIKYVYLILHMIT